MLGDRRVRPDVAHEHRDDHAFGLTDLAAVSPELLGQASGQESRQGLALLLTVDDRLVEQPQPLQRSFRARRDALGQLDEDRFHFGVDSLRRETPRCSDGLDRLALGHHPKELFFLRRQAAMRGHGTQQRIDDGGVECVPARRHGTDGIDQLVSLGDVVLQEVAVPGRSFGQQRDGIFGVVVLGEDDDASARMPLAHLLGCIDALSIESRGHPDVGDEDLRAAGSSPLQPPRRSPPPRRRCTGPRAVRSTP